MNQKIFKFGVAGAIGILIDFSITWLLKDQFYVNPYLSNASGFLLAVVNNFYLNKYWTFNDKSSNITKQFVLFLFISALGLLMNTMLLACFYGYFGMEFYLSKIITIGLVFFWNFGANKLITFKALNSNV